MLLLAAGAVSLRKVNPIKYFKTDAGRGVFGGIWKAVVFVLLVAVLGALSGCSGKWHNGASAFAGLEAAKKLSPQCKDEGPDNRTTSNLGLKYHAYQSKDKRFKGDVVYRHHSCAFSPDDASYDALGFELEYKFW